MRLFRVDWDRGGSLDPCRHRRAIAQPSEAQGAVAILLVHWCPHQKAHCPCTARAVAAAQALHTKAIDESRVSMEAVGSKGDARSGRSSRDALGSSSARQGLQSEMDRLEGEWTKACAGHSDDAPEIHKVSAGLEPS